jgi:thiol-disulfide isomerase/thioredoxin
MACVTGTLLPSFYLKDIQGNELDVSENKFTLINLWFIECAPCVKEIPYLNKLDSLSNLEVVGLPLNTELELTEFNKDNRITYPIVANSRSIIKDTIDMPFGYPLSYLIK